MRRTRVELKAVWQGFGFTEGLRGFKVSKVLFKFRACGLEGCSGGLRSGVSSLGSGALGGLGLLRVSGPLRISEVSTGVLGSSSSGFYSLGLKQMSVSAVAGRLRGGESGSIRGNSNLTSSLVDL